MLDIQMERLKSVETSDGATLQHATVMLTAQTAEQKKFICRYDK